MEVIGSVHHLGDETNVTASYTKRELVVKTEEQYPQFILIEFGQGKCNEYLDKLKANDQVKIGVNLRGREWVNPQGETKYFNQIQGWKIELVSEREVMKPQPAYQPTENFKEEDHDDLPF